MGKVLAERGVRNVVTLTWKYAAGDESVAGFKDAFNKGGGKVLKELTLPFPNVEFQPLLTEIASLKPDAVYVFFAGGGAAKFLKDWQAAGLKGKIPLYGAGFLTDGVARGHGRRRRGPRDDAALRRGHRHTAQPRVPRRVPQGVQDRPRRVRGAGLRRRTAVRRGCQGGGRRPVEEARSSSLPSRR